MAKGEKKESRDSRLKKKEIAEAEREARETEDARWADEDPALKKKAARAEAKQSKSFEAAAKKATMR